MINKEFAEHLKKNFVTVNITEEYIMKWVNVKDRMPDKDARYLVSVPYHTCPWIGVSSLRNGKFDDTPASHWMPLPSPPEK